MAFADRIWENRWLTHGGPLTEELQNALCKRLKVPYAIVYANGHLALDCAIKALGITDGEAITTPFTYISTANAITMNGLQPVFCDIKPNDCTIDESKIEALITPKTKAIIPVHVYGFPCNFQAIQSIADRYQLKVIYDAAHVFGVEVGDVGIANLGDASMFSFHATKVFHTVEGGTVTFRDANLADKLISAKNFGWVTAEEADSVSLNAKMTELHAAMGLANLRTIDQQIAMRKELVGHYLERLSDMEEIELFQWDDPAVKYNYAYFPVCVKKGMRVSRDQLVTRLWDEYSIQVRKYFFPLISELKCYRDRHSAQNTPTAKDISGRVVVLPLFAELRHEQVDYICDAIQAILAK